MAGLTDDQLRGHVQNGLSARRIADVMGVSYKAVRVAMGRLGLSSGPRRVADKTTQERTDLAEMMAEGAPSVSEAARMAGLSQSRADQHWQAIKRDLGVEQCR